MSADRSPLGRRHERRLGESRSWLGSATPSPAWNKHEATAPADPGPFFWSPRKPPWRPFYFFSGRGGVPWSAAFFAALDCLTGSYRPPRRPYWPTASRWVEVKHPKRRRTPHSKAGLQRMASHHF